VPANDPTLLFTNAGMNQFKDVFLGQEKREYSRAVSSQKCVAPAASITDLDNVGYTAAIIRSLKAGQFFLRRLFQARRHRLRLGVDHQVYGLPRTSSTSACSAKTTKPKKLWREVTDISPTHISRLDEADNFWQMGDTGPCGPCSEIYYDFGPKLAGRLPARSPRALRRFWKIWYSYAVRPRRFG